MKRPVNSLIGILIFNFIWFSQNLINNGSFEFGGSGVGFVAGGTGCQLISTPFSGNTQAGDYAFVSNPNTVASAKMNKNSR